MEYIRNRIPRFNQFQEIIDQPETKQCGKRLTLQIDGDVVEPDFRVLGVGAYGVALGLEHPVLQRKGLDVALKITSSRNNQEELMYNLLFSKIVEEGRTPNFPLYSRCKNLGRAEGDCDCGSCEFKNRILNQEAGNTVKEIFKNRISEDIPVRDCLVTFSERVDGDSGQYLLRRLELDGDLAALESMFSIFGQVIFALKEFHERGLAHNDSHVGNIFLKRLDDQNNYIRYITMGETYTVRVGNDLAMLADFGLVRKLEPPTLITSGDRAFMAEKIGGILSAAGLPRANMSNWYHSAIHDAFLFVMFIIRELQVVSGLYPILESVVKRFATRLISLSNTLSAQEQIRYSPIQLIRELENVLEEPAKSIWMATVNRDVFPKGPILGTYSVGVIPQVEPVYSSKASVKAAAQPAYSSKAAAQPAYSSKAAYSSSAKPTAQPAYSSKDSTLPSYKYVSNPVVSLSSRAPAKQPLSSRSPAKQPLSPRSPAKQPLSSRAPKQKIPTVAQLIQILKKSSSCRSKLKKCKKSGCKSMRRKCSPKRR